MGPHAGSSFTWTAVLAPSRDYGARNFHTLTPFLGRLWIIGGRTGINKQESALNDVYVTDDGAYWTRAVDKAEFPPRLGHTCVVFHGKLWVIGGAVKHEEYGPTGQNTYYNDVWSSSDGINWNCETPEAPFLGRYGHACFVLQDKLWIVGGRGKPGDMKDVWSSPDGVHWTLEQPLAPFTPRFAAAAVEYLGKVWLIGGGDYGKTPADVWATDDGIHWNLAIRQLPFPGAVHPQCFVTQDKLWLVFQVGTGNRLEVWNTADMGYWNRLPSDIGEPYYHFTGAVFKNRLFLTGGQRNWMPWAKTLSSPDGLRWEWPANGTNTLKPGSADLTTLGPVVPFQGKLFALAGEDETLRLYCSGDGTDWAQAGDDLPFTATPEASLVVFDSKLWVLGGLVPGIWFSEDGTKWEMACEEAPFGIRHLMGVAVFDQALWVVAGEAYGGWEGYQRQKKEKGYAEGRVTRDVWKTLDGTRWERVREEAPFEGRFYPGVFAFQGKLWVAGGGKRGGETLTDLWSTTDGKEWKKEGDAPVLAGWGKASFAPFGGELWMVRDMGGKPPYEGYNIPWLWRTKDGLHWTIDDRLAEAGLRMDDDFFVFNNQLWLAGSDEYTHQMVIWRAP
jgi:hypothetical protein